MNAVTINGRTYDSINAAMEELKKMEAAEKASNMTIYKGKDIEAKYSAIVKEYIENGCTINATTMRGSQGEQAKIDLTDGTATYRVRLERSIDTDYTNIKDEIRAWPEGYQIIIEKFDAEVTDIWNGRGELEKAITFFRLGRGYGLDGAFVQDEEDYLAFTEHRKTIRRQREEAQHGLDRNTGKYDRAIELPSKKMEAVAEMCRKHNGWKTVKADEITIKRCNPDYRTWRGETERTSDVEYIVRKKSGTKALRFKTSAVEA